MSDLLRQPRLPAEPTLARLLACRAFPPQLGGGIPIECFLDVRIVGDASTGQWEPFVEATLGCFQSRAAELGWFDDQQQSSTDRVSVTGEGELVQYLGKNAIGQLLALSAAKRASFITTANVAGVDPKQARGFCYAGVLPTAVAQELEDVVRTFLEHKGCSVE